ncbi:putative effector protein/Mannose-binding lectin [Ceratobasidium theobromae]|uniref:Putative effector protein/Mannose-binding lectin n=1 Tax=Ceratobasidium theobromae TaxID=1582974 RepID=A0A5N5QBG3_9AGAM|nr:putative effector protein/Mannose-binding lectin [Ceratobasidium theobromae]
MMLHTSIFLLAISSISLGQSSPQRSKAFGGGGGRPFDDGPGIPPNPRVASVTLRGANRLDAITFSLAGRQPFTHGGSGGSPKTLNLGQGEYVTALKVCRDYRSEWEANRVYYARVATSNGRTIEVGTPSTSCTTHSAPNGMAIVGAHGRSGGEVDGLGAIYGPRR